MNQIYFPYTAIQAIYMSDRKKEESIGIKTATDFLTFHQFVMSTPPPPSHDTCELMVWCTNECATSYGSTFGGRSRGVLRYYTTEHEYMYHLTYRGEHILYIWEIPFEKYMHTFPPKLRAMMGEVNAGAYSDKRG